MSPPVVSKIPPQFEQLKWALCQSPVFYSLNFNKIFTLQTDALGIALGAVLTQKVEDEEWPIVYSSHKLLGSETRYSTTECLAPKWSTELFLYYLLGKTFVLVTDYAPLKELQSMKNDNT